MDKRKPLRLENWDYSQDGVYYVTICTKDKEKVLGVIVGGGVLDAPFPRLSPIGKIVQNRMIEMCDTYIHINIDEWVIMPNHIHLLLRVHMSMTAGCGTSRTPSPTNAVVPSFVSTLKRYVNREVGHNIWQRSYYDRIIRSERDYLQYAQYIRDNPIKWLDDEYY